MNRWKQWLAAMLAVLLLAGCSPRGEQQQESSEEPELYPLEAAENSSRPEEQVSEAGTEEEPEEEEEGEEEEEASQGTATPAPQLSNPVSVSGLEMESQELEYDVSADSITVIVYNDRDRDLTTDAWYTVEQKTDGGWSPVPLRIYYAPGPVWLPAGEETALTIGLCQDQHSYVPGVYRAVKEVTVGEEEIVQISAEFVLAA